MSAERNPTSGSVGMDDGYYVPTKCAFTECLELAEPRREHCKRCGPQYRPPPATPDDTAALVARARKLCMPGWTDEKRIALNLCDTIERLTAERDRYRGALRAIAGCDSVVAGDVVDVARRALSPENT